MAGFFDGEGYVGLQGNSNHGLRAYVKLKVSVSNTDLDSLSPFKQRFGGVKVRSWQGRPGNKVVYRWDCQGRRAYDFLVMIAPYLRTKRAQADLAIKFWELPWRGKPSHPIRDGGGLRRRDEECATDNAIALQMKAMKRA